MAEAVEILKEKSDECVSTSEDVKKHPLIEHTEKVQRKTSEMNMQQGGVKDKDLNNERKKKKKKRKSKSAENTVTPHSEPQTRKEMQSSGGGIHVPQLNVKQQMMMSQHHIQLKKPSLKNPRGRFVCTLCNYFCDTSNAVENHIHSQSHINKLEDYIEAESVKLLPPPLDEQKHVLSELIKKIVVEHGISKLFERETISERIEEFMKASYPSCTVKLYGSSRYLAGLAHSDVNLNINIPGSEDRLEIMMAVYDHIREDNVSNINVNFNMSADVPTITFEDLSSKLLCSIAFNNGHACDVAHVLNKLLSLDKRALQLAATFRYWAHLCCLDQIECGTLPAHAFPIFVIHYLQQLEDPVLPVLSDPEIFGEESAIPEVLGSSVPRNNKWETKNKMSLGELWLGLFKYYVIDFDVQERVVSIRIKEPVTQMSKKWNARRIGIEDPVAPFRNVAKSLVNSKLFHYFMTCLRTSLMYFATPQMQVGPIFRRVQKLPADMTEMRQLLMERDQFMDFICSYYPCFLSAQQINEKGPNLVMATSDPNYRNIGQFIVTPEQAQVLFQRFNPAFLTYIFSKRAFVGGKKLPVVCTFCREEGHTKEKCPENSLPPLEKLPNLPKSFLQYLSSMCEAIYEIWALTPSELEARENIVSHLLQFLNKEFPDAALTLFGSSCNGFGLKQSDVDICFTFTTCPPENKEELDFGKLIQDLYGLLRKYTPFSNLVPITTAKVPILKFYHFETKLDGDISFHNTLALKNTQLIKTYSNIDERAKVLGYVVKRFAKICKICDASKGSLSSYAYILMMIHFLQQCSPPVLPVLQEICRPRSTEEYILENCDTYFFEDLARLPHIWPESGGNKKSVGELWIEFLCYYTENYNFKEHVITIRRKRPMSKFEKLWNSKSMAIEDPFDINHNLGIGLSPKMHQFILKAFRNGRSYFSHVENMVDIKPLPKAAEKYFEASKVKGSPPDRGCHNCKRIGHVIKDCPARMQREDGSSDSREYERSGFAQSPKSEKPNGLKNDNTKGKSNYAGNWQERSGSRDEASSRIPSRHERGRGNTKGSPNHEGGWQEIPRDDHNGQRIPCSNEKARKTTWWNKSRPQAIPVPVPPTPVMNTRQWNVHPVPLANVNVHPQIQVQMQSLSRKWQIGSECHNESGQPKGRRVIGGQPEKFTGRVFDIYAQPSNVSSGEFHNKTTN